MKEEYRKEKSKKFIEIRKLKHLKNKKYINLTLVINLIHKEVKMLN